MPDPSTPPEKPEPEQTPEPQLSWRSLLWFLLMMLIVVWVWQDMFATIDTRVIPYSEFKRYVAGGAVIECEIREHEIIGTIDVEKADAVLTSTESAGEQASTESEPKPTEPAEGAETKVSEQAADATTFKFRTIRIEDPKLLEELDKAEIKYVGVPPSLIPSILIWMLPLGLLLLFWMFLSRGLAARGQGVIGFGRSRAKLIADEDTGVTFDDVAGCDEAKYELQEVVDFLQHPDRYTGLGAKIPKGVLLVGPPGTGKTLLARAVAGQAKVPFFSLSGSDFVEMFVGVGAARVRDLFQQATAKAPCIVFIDELDAIGRQRGVHVGAVNDEREHTLNQLLVEMDGFDANAGVILLAATNRPDVLDRALLRPGRFDRQVVLDAPDIAGRKAILEVHSRNKPLDDDVDLQTVAQATPGFSGADLANVMNEAALLSARYRSKAITQKNVEEAIEKVIAGPERKSRRLEPHEKERIAYHEVGHALVGTFSEHADPVHKISIVPRGKAALGYTLQLPTGEQFLLTQAELTDRLTGLLGGRAAEDVKYGEISTGGENDLERATVMARQMVCMYGMSEKVGLVHCAHRESLLVFDPEASGRLDCSDATANQVDEEVKLLLDQSYQRAKKILIEHRGLLDRIAQELLEKETLDAAAFKALLDRNHQGDS
jgi:cell division protease FtsH